MGHDLDAYADLKSERDFAVERRNHFEQLAKTLQTELDALKAAHTWIKTSERMPDNDARKVLVMICGKGSKRVEFADYYYRHWSIGDDGYDLEEYETVTHWMPQPEPPK